MSPQASPTDIAIAVTAIPTINEVLIPYAILVSTSRPR
jgi:hypothetical protein